MARIRSYPQAMNYMLGQIHENTDDISRKNLQRRTKVVDIYGDEFTRIGDGGAPATFYISISPDLVYFERFEFKLIIQPFISSVGGGGTQSVEVQINPTSLNISNDSITPNPHTHSSVPHSHNILAGVTLVNTTANDFTVSIDNIDVTPYLRAQYDGQWIDGEGIYPSDNDLTTYDILEVASVMSDEGKITEREALLRPGYKKVQIASASPFQCTLPLYLKYSHINR